MRSFQVLILGILLWSAETLAANPVVEMKTSVGAVRIELYADKAPKTVVNFLQYVKDGFYNGLVFHRVIDGFMIQGGGHYPDLREKKGDRPPIENEAGNGLKNDAGTITMARTSNPHSATLMKNCAVAECGLDVRAMVMVPASFFNPLPASFSIGGRSPFFSRRSG